MLSTLHTSPSLLLVHSPLASPSAPGCLNRESRESRGAKIRRFAPNREALNKIPNRLLMYNETSSAVGTIYFAVEKDLNPAMYTSSGNEVDLEIGDADGCIKETESSSYYIWQNFTVSNSSDSKKGGTKNAVLKFCDKKWLLYFEGSSPHFGAFCIRPRKSWNTGMYHHQQK